jgi:hypothetical protein
MYYVGTTEQLTYISNILTHATKLKVILNLAQHKILFVRYSSNHSYDKFGNKANEQK